MICYYALKISARYDGSNSIDVLVDEDYLKLTVSAVAFLSSDMFVKYCLSDKNKLYYALQLHHFIGISGYILSYYLGAGNLLVTNLSLFELSSIPLLFYSERILVPISLPATWLTYLLVRILWGNVILVSGIYQISNSQFPSLIVWYVNSLQMFFVVANNYWFYLLTKQLRRKINIWNATLNNLVNDGVNRVSRQISSLHDYIVYHDTDNIRLDKTLEESTFCENQ